MSMNDPLTQAQAMAALAGQSGSNTQNPFMCISADRVLDTALDVRELPNVVLNYNDLYPTGLISPFTFNGVVALNNEPNLRNVLYKNDANDATQLRVSLDVDIPVRIFLSDANGRPGTARATLTLHHDFLMDKPNQSIFPFRFEAMAAAGSSSGTFDNAGRLTVSLFAVVLIKMVVSALVRAFTDGYCTPCPIRSTSATGGTKFLNLPFYPDAKIDCEPVKDC